MSPGETGAKDAIIVSTTGNNNRSVNNASSAPQVHQLAEDSSYAQTIRNNAPVAAYCLTTAISSSCDDEADEENDVDDDEDPTDRELEPDFPCEGEPLSDLSTIY